MHLVRRKIWRWLGAVSAASACLGACSLETEPFPGGFGASGASAPAGGSGGATGCDQDADCGPLGPCEGRKCGASGECVVTYGPTALLMDPAGDCVTRSCTPEGTYLEKEDAGDVPVDDGNPCTVEVCLAGQPAMEPALPGEPCGSGPACLGSTVKAQDTCDGAGTCQAGEETACAPYACDMDAYACKTSCTPATQAADCDDGFCVDGVCLSKKGVGGPCASAQECTTAFCADGVCCESTCDGPCLSCNLGDSQPGGCGPLPTGVVDVCVSGQACDGGGCAGLLGKKVVGDPCAVNADCFNGNCHQGLCRLPNGVDCSAVQHAADCQSNLCKAGVCQPCTSADDCGSAVCLNGRCTLTMGAHCGVGIDCLSGNCVGNACQ